MIRRILAGVLAPAAATFAFWALDYGLELLGPRGPGSALDTLMFFMLLGLPVAYCGSILVAAPLYVWMRRRNRLNPRTILAAAVLAGVLTAVAIPFVFGMTFRGLAAVRELLSDGRSLLVTVFLGSIAGLVGGGVFVVVGPPASRVK